VAISFDRKCKCGYPLTGKQRMYCSRLCNHKAAWARRSAKAKARVELLKATKQRIDALSDEFSAQTQEVTAESSPSRRDLISFTARTEPVVIRHLVGVEHDGSATTYTYKPTPPSLWQRLRKRVGDVVATIKYLSTASIDEYP